VLTYRASSLFNEENVARLLTEMPRTMSSFAPLGLVLVMILGASVAERAGLFSALIRGSLRNAPKAILTPIVASSAWCPTTPPTPPTSFSSHSPPSRSQPWGVTPLPAWPPPLRAFRAGSQATSRRGRWTCSCSAFTQEAARIIEPGWNMNPLGNWWFILSIVVLFTPLIWYLTDRVIEPRLGKWGGTRTRN
jgi:aminobenzoyl-glutamate transport protein